MHTHLALVVTLFAATSAFAQDARPVGFAGDDPDGGQWVPFFADADLRVFLDTTSLALSRDTVTATTWWANSEALTYPPEPPADRIVQVDNFHCRANVMETLHVQAYLNGSQNGGESYEPGEAARYVFSRSVGGQLLREVCERAGWDPDSEPGPPIQVRGGLPAPPPPPIPN